ncbi:MAG: NAD(P)/FAD-dependent oxidoreductase, partial [Terriglobia bacterium]
MTAAEQGHKLHRIVIVGGGIGGLVTATHLVRRLGRSGKAEVLLVDRNRAHVWKPMLHAFAAGTSDYANENVSFIPHAKLTGYKYWPGDFGGLDRKTQTIKLKPTPLPAAGEMLPATTIHYDTLILALGSQVNDFGTPGVLEHCHFIDDIGQATAFNDLLRSRVVLAANAGEDLSVVIVGGGATGVELAAELTQRMEIVSSYDSDVTRTHLRLTLIETTSRVLGPFPERISHSVEVKLRGLGVDVRTGTKVVGVDARGVSLDGDWRIEASLVVWAAGVKGPDMMSNLDGVEINRRGQAQVGDTLQT